MSGPRRTRTDSQLGLFVTLEGPEGSGKSTQQGLLAQRLEAAGHATTETREPGGTEAGEIIRQLLLRPDLAGLKPETEAFLFCAARSELVELVIRPRLAEGHVVICDRFADATRAYQGYGAGLGRKLLEEMIDLATGGLEPDLTVLLDLPVRIGLARRRADCGQWTRIDAADEEFHERVREGYLELAKQNPRRWVVIDARRETETVAAEVWRHVSERAGRARSLDAPVSGGSR